MTDDVADALTRLNGTAEAQLRITLMLVRQMHGAGQLNAGEFVEQLERHAESIGSSGQRVLDVAAERLVVAARCLREAAAEWR